MRDRLPLRAEFNSLENQKKSDANFVTRSSQLVSMHRDLVDGFKFLVDFLDGKTSKTEVINNIKDFATTEDSKKIVNSLEKLDKTTLSTKIDLKPVLEALKGLQGEISTIEKKSPEFKQRESVKVENLNEIKFDTSKVVDAIKALKLKVDAPIINVEPPNLKPIKDIMLDLLKSLNKVKLEVPKSFKIDNLKDIPLADLSTVEKKLDTGNKYLKEISEKKFGGGGGSAGESTLAFPLYAGMTTGIVTVGAITTITKTDGTIILTTVVDSTDANNVTVVKTWS